MSLFHEVSESVSQASSWQRHVVSFWELHYENPVGFLKRKLVKVWRGLTKTAPGGGGSTLMLAYTLPPAIHRNYHRSIPTVLLCLMKFLEVRRNRWQKEKCLWLDIYQPKNSLVGLIGRLFSSAPVTTGQAQTGHALLITGRLVALQIQQNQNCKSCNQGTHRGGKPSSNNTWNTCFLPRAKKARTLLEPESRNLFRKEGSLVQEDLVPKSIIRYMALQCKEF